MKKLVLISLVVLLSGILSGPQLFAQVDDDYGDAFEMLQQQLEQMIQNFDGDIGGSFFLSDTMILQDPNALGTMPWDSLMKGYSFNFPEMQNDSLLQKGFGPSEDIFGPDFQGQLDQMFRTLEGLGPEYFEGLEDLMRQFDENQISPDGDSTPERKELKSKKKIYKI